MTTTRTRGLGPRTAALLGAALLLAALLPASALAAAPANDDIGSATVVGALPFSDGPLDTTEATVGATDPSQCIGTNPDLASVWYSFTPASDGSFMADTFGSDYDTTLHVGTANGAGGIDVIDCNDDAVDLQSAVAWSATAGTTYLISVGTCCGEGSPGETGGGGTLVFHVDVAPPAPEVEVTLATTGTFTRYGTATIHGTVTCENAADYSLDIEVAQRVGRFLFRGFAFVEAACDGEQPFSVDVTSDSGRFGGGSVDVVAFAGACNGFLCAFDDDQARVRLRH